MIEKKYYFSSTKTFAEPGEKEPGYATRYLRGSVDWVIMKYRRQLEDSDPRKYVDILDCLINALQKHRDYIKYKKEENG